MRKLEGLGLLPPQWRQPPHVGPLPAARTQPASRVCRKPHSAGRGLRPGPNERCPQAGPPRGSAQRVQSPREAEEDPDRPGSLAAGLGAGRSSDATWVLQRQRRRDSGKALVLRGLWRASRWASLQLAPLAFFVSIKRQRRGPPRPALLRFSLSPFSRKSDPQASFPPTRLMAGSPTGAFPWGSGGIQGPVSSPASLRVQCGSHRLEVGEDWWGRRLWGQIHWLPVTL